MNRLKSNPPRTCIVNENQTWEQQITMFQRHPGSVRSSPLIKTQESKTGQVDLDAQSDSVTLPSVQRTYSSRNRKKQLQRSSSPQSTLSSSPPASPRLTKRPLSEISFKGNPSLLPPLKRTKVLPKVLSTTSKTKTKTKGQQLKAAKANQQKILTQLHFNIDQTTLRKCPLCDLSYIKGAQDDEALHKTHCARVQQGMEWGREEEKDGIRDGQSIIFEVESDIKFTGRKEKGRIICLPADINGKIGAKLTILLQTINLALSAPPLTNSEIQVSKAYLFLLPHDKIAHRERIIGCVIAQRISTAMAIVPISIPNPMDNPSHLDTRRLVPIGSSGNLFCDPTPLPTSMGIPRLFVPSTHRRLGIAKRLLSAAARTFIHGCSLDPEKGQVAFSQPTCSGQAVMDAWGKGGVRIYED